MKLKLLVTLLSVAMATVSFAENNQGKPICPSISAIKAGGVQQAFSQDNNEWTVINPESNYNTHRKWGFAISSIEAQNAEEALAKATVKIQLINGFVGPEKLEEPNIWGCLYFVEDDNTFPLIAITPAKYLTNPPKLQTFLHR